MIQIRYLWHAIHMNLVLSQKLVTYFLNKYNIFDIAIENLISLAKAKKIDH